MLSEKMESIGRVQSWCLKTGMEMKQGWRMAGNFPEAQGEQS